MPQYPRWSLKTGCLLALASLLSSCGGGGSETPTALPEQAGISVKSTLAANARIENEGSVTMPTPDSVEFAATTNHVTGDVVIVSGVAIKLGDPLPATDATRAHFKRQVPLLKEIFSSLIFDGDFSTTQAAIESAPTDRKKALAAAAPKCSPSADIAGLFGTKCEVNYRSTDFPLVSLSGTFGVGARAQLKNWDAIKNTGEGVISIGYDAVVALQLSKEPDKGDVKGICSSGGPLGEKRVLLATLPIPTTAAGILINIPVCVAYDAKPGIVGTFYRLQDKGRVDIAVGKGAPPAIVTGAPTSSETAPSPDDTVWAWQSNSAEGKFSVFLIEAEPSATVSGEVSVEISAFKTISVGLVSGFHAKGTLKAKVAPVIVDVPVSLATIKGKPLYCAGFSLTASYDLTAYAAIPAFWFFEGEAVSAKIYGKELKKYEEQWGGCNFAVKTEVTLTGSPNPGKSPTFSVRVAKSDPDSLKLWDDKFATGTVDVANLAGVVLCTMTLGADGSGQCPYTFTGLDRTEVLTATYRGDEHFLTSTSPPLNYVVLTPAPGFWDITWRMDSCNTLPVEAGTWSTFRCNVTGGWAGATGGKIYLANSAGVTGPNAVSEVFYGLTARRPKTVAFGPNSSQFSITYRWADIPAYDQQVPVVFDVLTRSATSMTGKLGGTAPYTRYIDFYNQDYRIEVRNAPFSGTWSAIWRTSQLPMPSFTVPGDFCTTFNQYFQAVRDDAPANMGSQGTLLGVGTCSF